MNRIFKNGVILLLAASFLLSGLVVVLAQDDELKPAIVIPKMRHDFGKVFEKESYDYEFLVQNRGKADLVIESVKPG